MPGPSRVFDATDGVHVVYEGRVLPPPVRPAKAHMCCPLCGAKAGWPDRYGTTKLHYLFECHRCVDVTTGRPTRWKEPRGNPKTDP